MAISHLPAPPNAAPSWRSYPLTESADPIRGRLWWTLFWGWWTIFALVYAQWYYVMAKSNAQPMTWTDALGIGFLDMYLWALLALTAFSLARHLPLTRRHWHRTVAIHLAAGAAVLVGRLLVEMFFARYIEALTDGPLTTKLLVQTPAHALGYFTLVGVGYALVYYRRYREREMRAAHLEGQLTRAQLDVLKMQLHPHFLFNTLNAISALMHRDVKAADRMLARLGDLLRLSLEMAGTQEVTLRDELEFLEPYLEIEQTRFGDRLAVEWTIEPETLDALVPHLILQPLVENSIRHGIAPRSAPGRIEISAHRSNGSLQLEVRDNGRGLDLGDQTRKSTGVGLSNTRARLAQLYNGSHRFEVAGAPAGGVVVAMEIPFRSAPNGLAVSANRGR
jgi:signal transduction histidine kinase